MPCAAPRSAPPHCCYGPFWHCWCLHELRGQRGAPSWRGAVTRRARGKICRKWVGNQMASLTQLAEQSQVWWSHVVSGMGTCVGLGSVSCPPLGTGLSGEHRVDTASSWRSGNPAHLGRGGDGGRGCSHQSPEGQCEDRVQVDSRNELGGVRPAGEDRPGRLQGHWTSRGAQPSPSAAPRFQGLSRLLRPIDPAAS